MLKHASTFALAALVVAATAACATDASAPAAPPAPTITTPAPASTSAAAGWVVDGTGYSGPKIGLPGSEHARHLVYCVPARAYQPDRDTGYPPEVPIRDVEVPATVADTIEFGAACPAGPTEEIGGAG